MIAVIQRVSKSSVRINHNITREIGVGLMILLGIETSDDSTEIEWLCRKILNLRVFPDDEKVMNRSLLDIQGDLLLISQFTLHASTKKGNRPSYIKAARPEQAIPLYQECIHCFERELKRPIQTGEFGAEMEVSLVNDGPVTIIIDTQNKI